jgi:hypothetical protein
LTFAAAKCAANLTIFGDLRGAAFVTKVEPTGDSEHDFHWLAPTLAFRY